MSFMTARTGRSGISVEKSAVISSDGVYRYSLGRSWAPKWGRVLWIMLNPSTADENVDDATIRRCFGFTRDWGYGELEVVNLFAYRATDPKKLFEAADPVGPGNDDYIDFAVSRAGLIIAAWGTHGSYRGRAEEVRRRYSPLLCLETTKDGHPRHPLYIPLTAVPIVLP